MPPDGYHDVTSYDETDFNGIISVIINCTEFQRRMSFAIGNQPNPLTEARVIGRNIRHSPDLKVTDTDLADYFATLNTLLTDTTFLASDRDAQQAVLKLKQLERNALPISTEDVNELLKEARATVEAGKRQLAESTESGKRDLEGVVFQGKTAIEAGNRQLETGKSEIEGVVSRSKTVIETGNRKIDETVSQGKAVLESESRRLEKIVSEGQTVLVIGKHQLEDATTTGKYELESVVSQGKRQLEDAVSTTSGVTKRAKLEIEDAVAKSRDVVQVGKRELEEALQKIKAVSSMSEAEQRKDLRQRLVKYYQKQLNSAPISPLLSDKDERLDKFYVPPKIEEKDHRRLGDDQQQKGFPISTYKQIFCKDEGLANTVFLVGEAGMGKTSFSAMCTVKWAAAQLSVSIRDAGERGLDQGEKEENPSECPLLNEEGLDQGKEEEIPTECLLLNKEDLDQGKEEKNSIECLLLNKEDLDEGKEEENPTECPLLNKEGLDQGEEEKNPTECLLLNKEDLDQEKEEENPTECLLLNKEGLDQGKEKKNHTEFLLLNKEDLDQGEEEKNPTECPLLNKNFNVRREYQELLHSLSDNDGEYVDSNKEEFCELLLQPRYDLLQDEDTFKDIEFIFNIKLRDCCENCELSDMIRDQLINMIYRPDERADGYSTLISVLSNQKCFIIADGLDEWSHPTETKCLCSVEDKAIPHLSQTLDATVLITSRPWRMSRNRVKDTKIGKYLEIKGVASTQLLVQKTLVCLNEKVAEEKICLDFIRFVARRKLVRLIPVPIIVLLLVCLWFDGIHESFSLCDIYAYMLDMMFGRKSLPVLSVLPECIPLLQCFKQTEHVQNCYNIALKLAQLAFEKLFSRDRKSSLVFQSVDCLTQQELLFVLKTGIMRETKSQSLIRKSSSFSFIHKTVQEFLAAVHIAYQTKEVERVIKPNYHEEVKEYLASQDGLKFSSISDVSQIFIYMCGLNSEVAQKMSALMSIAVMEHPDICMYDDWGNTVQQTLCSGLREAMANNVHTIQLHLMSLNIHLMNRDLSTLKTLISKNKSQIRHIGIDGQEKWISEKELQELFISSKDTLKNVRIYHRAGQYDLSACCRLQYLIIRGPLTSNTTINTNSLVELMLYSVSEKVECSILQSLEQNCEQLNIFKITCIKNISLFCKTLPQLNHLKQISIEYTTLGDHPLLLPPSVNIVHLTGVIMSARCLRELVKRLENFSHTVNCRINMCTVEPISDYEDIKRYTQSSKNISFC